MTSLANQLAEINNSLTPENWTQGSYFRAKSNALCMCAHGAVQAQCNPQVQQALKDYPNSAAAAGAARPAAGSAAAGEAIRFGQSPQQVWTNRPDWVKQDRIVGDKNYGNLDLHFLLGMVGMTVRFNDDPGTTLEMVKEKFQEAVELAKTLGV